MFFLRPPGPIFVGRDLEAEVPLFDRAASRRHFRVDFLDEGYRLTDLRSRAGTYVNDRPADSRLLAHGDRIRAGKTLLTFALDPPQDDLNGKDVAGYKVIERVGGGGMGSVYRALQTSLDRVVAFKVLAARYARDAEFCRLFVEEARAAAELAHPNIVRVYDVNLTGGLLFYSMEYMAHGNAEDLCRRIGPLPAIRAARIVGEVCAGLEFAHRKGFVHRDVKPSNVLLHASGVAKVGDLGIAVRLRDDRSPTTGSIGGSPHYMAPEQILGRDVDARSDVYSLGATLFRLMAGRPPFLGDSLKDVLMAHVREDPPDLRLYCPRVPEALANIVRLSLSKRPESRPQTAEVLGDMLRDLREPLAVASAWERPPPSRPLTRRLFNALLLVAAFAVGSAGGAVVGSLGREIRTRGRRITRIRRTLSEGMRAIGGGDLRAAQAKREELRQIQGSPDDWDLLRSEIDAFEDALKRAETEAHR